MMCVFNADEVIETLKNSTEQPAESITEGVYNLIDFIFDRIRSDLRAIQSALYKPHEDQDIYDMLEELIEKL